MPDMIVCIAWRSHPLVYSPLDNSIIILDAYLERNEK